jgi:hypothetical protein
MRYASFIYDINHGIEKKQNYDPEKNVSPAVSRAEGRLPENKKKKNVRNATPRN